MPSKVLAKVIRGGTVESVHRGHFVVLDGDAKVISSAGDPRVVTFFRSAAKPFQAMPFITSGAADVFGYSDEEIALAAASHSGEARHVRIAQLMLERCGLTEAHLRCGSHLPFYEKEAERMLRAGEYPTQLHNNCSGKHAAMLAFARHIDADLGSYDAAEHPVQQEALKTVAQFTEIPESRIALAVDGCAVPNFAVSVEAMGRSFINLMTPEKFDSKTQDACRRLVSAMVRFPELIGGTDRLDTILMQAAEGRIISKVGADGVWLCGILPDGLFPKGAAIALKIEDGNDLRARPVLAAEILKQLGILRSDDLPGLSPMPISNRRGDVVGVVEPAVQI